MFIHYCFPSRTSSPMADRNFIKLPIEFPRNKNWIYFSNSAQPIASNVFPFSVYEGFSLLMLAHLLCTTSKTNSELWIHMFFAIQIQKLYKETTIIEQNYNHLLYLTVELYFSMLWVLLNSELRVLEQRQSWRQLYIILLFQLIAIFIYS